MTSSYPPTVLGEPEVSRRLMDDSNSSSLDETAVDASDSEDDIFRLNDGLLVLVINGYITPTVVVVTLATNCIVCAVLLRPHMRSPTNVLLVAIATSDMLTGLWSVPGFLHFYGPGSTAYRDWVPHHWCFAYMASTEFVPTVFHTASIWLTVALAVQRYVYVCHALAARHICTVQNFVRVIVGVFLAAAAAHFCRLLENDYVQIEVPSRIDPNQTVTACRLQLISLIASYTDVYYNVYFWFRVVAVHLVPCSALVVLTALLVSAMQRAQRRRQLLLKQNRRSESRRLAESNWTTLMLVAVVGVFLVVEIPLAVVMILLIVRNTFDVKILDPATNELATLVINTLIVLSYPLNFVIYCGMSRQFRSTFRAMFCRCCRLSGSDSGVLGAVSGCGLTAARVNAAGEPTNYVSMATAVSMAPSPLPAAARPTRGNNALLAAAAAAADDDDADDAAKVADSNGHGLEYKGNLADTKL